MILVETPNNGPFKSVKSPENRIKFFDANYLLPDKRNIPQDSVHTFLNHS